MNELFWQNGSLGVPPEAQGLSISRHSGHRRERQGKTESAVEGEELFVSLREQLAEQGPRAWIPGDGVWVSPPAPEPNPEGVP